MTPAPGLEKIINEPATGSANDARSRAIEAVRQLLLNTRSQNTRRAYEGDLYHFFASLGEEVDASAVELLLSLDAPRLLVTLRGYVTGMRRAKLAEATIARRLAAVRSLIRVARQLGAETPDPKMLLGAIRVEQYTEADGPSFGEVALLLDSIDRGTIKGLRDYAIIWLLATNGLRREEIVSADIRDFEPRRRRLRIRGKGRGGQQEGVTLVEATVAALSAYLEARDNPGLDAPLIASCDHRVVEGEARLTGAGLWSMIDVRSQEVLKVRLHPHSFRHSAITEAAIATGGNIPIVQQFSRHKNVQTVMGYVARSRDAQGEVSQMLEDRLQQARKGK